MVQEMNQTRKIVWNIVAGILEVRSFDDIDGEYELDIVPAMYLPEIFAHEVGGWRGAEISPELYSRIDLEYGIRPCTPRTYDKENQ